MSVILLVRLVWVGLASMTLTRLSLVVWCRIFHVFRSLFRAVARNPSLASRLIGYAILVNGLIATMSIFTLMMAFLVRLLIFPEFWF